MSKRPAEVIAHIYVIYFQASLFPLTFAPGPQQNQLTVSTSYMLAILASQNLAMLGVGWGGGGGSPYKGWEDRREMK